MASRYLAFISPPGRGLSLPSVVFNRPINFHRSFISDNCCVYTSEEGVAVRINDNGVFVGDVFSREYLPSPVTKIDRCDASRIIEGGCAYISKQYWGGFIAFIKNADSPTFSAYRDPSGSMPCFYLLLPGEVIALASDLDALIDTGLLHPEIDWPFLSEQFLRLTMPNEQTAIKSVRELMPGFGIANAGTGWITKSVWNPWDHVGSIDVRSDTEISEMLHQVVSGCVAAWANRFGNVLVGVSGGLDSSILAACCANVQGRATYFTMSTQGGEGDERRYAGLLTDHLEVALSEHFYDLDVVDLYVSTSAHWPKPVGSPAMQSYHRIQHMIADETGVQAFFSGGGGDDVFCLMQSATPIVDRITAEGFGRGALDTLNDICGITGCSMWDAIRMAFRKVLKGAVYYRPLDERFLAPHNAASIVGSMLHPWLDGPKGALPGKVVHVANLLSILGFIDGYSRKDHRPQIYPLLSQPIAELCLSIPTWAWCQGGMNRAVARRAFRHQLPSSITNRKSKGGPAGFVFELLTANKPAVRDFLFNGLLAEHGLLDLPSLRMALDDGRQISNADCRRLSELMDAEAWVRHWQGRARDIEELSVQTPFVSVH